MTGTSPSSSIQRRRLAMAQQTITDQELAISRLHDAGADTADREAELVRAESVRSSLRIELQGPSAEGSWVR